MLSIIIGKVLWFLVVSFPGTAINADVSQLRYSVRRRRIPGKNSIQDRYYQHSQFESGTEDAISTKKANLDGFIALLRSPSPSPISGVYSMSTPSNTTASPSWKEEITAPNILNPVSKESSFHETESIRSTANAPTAPPSRLSSTSFSPTSITSNGFIPISKKKKTGSSKSSSSPTISRSAALEKSRPPTPSPMTLQPVVSLRPTTLERNVSISLNTAAPNSSSIIQSGLVPEEKSSGRTGDSIKIEKFGLEFAPTTRSILRDNDAIHATEVAVGKFLTSQIEDASNVTITAVDAQFIPYSRSRGESLLRERSNLKDKLGSTIIYYQGEIFLSARNRTSEEPKDDPLFASSVFVDQLEASNITTSDINSVFQDPNSVTTFVTNLNSANNDHLSQIKSVMFAPFYPSQAQLQDVPKRESYPIDMILLDAALIAACTILFAFTIILLLKRKRELTKVTNQSSSSSELSCSTSQGKSMDSSFPDDISVSTKGSIARLNSQFRPPRKRQKKIIKAQIKFDSNLSTIQEGDCETESSLDVRSRAKPKRNIQKSDAGMSC